MTFQSFVLFYFIFEEHVGPLIDSFAILMAIFCHQEFDNNANPRGSEMRRSRVVFIHYNRVQEASPGGSQLRGFGSGGRHLYVTTDLLV